MLDCSIGRHQRGAAPCEASGRRLSRIRGVRRDGMAAAPLLGVGRERVRGPPRGLAPMGAAPRYDLRADHLEVQGRG